VVTLSVTSVAKRKGAEGPRSRRRAGDMEYICEKVLTELPFKRPSPAMRPRLAHWDRGHVDHKYEGPEHDRPPVMIHLEDHP